MMRIAFLSGLFLFIQIQTYAQVITAEDSLQAGLTRDKKSIISGYGEAYYQNNLSYQDVQASLKRNVLFIGYKFNKNISLFTELEIEDALSKQGSAARGSVGMEQAFLKMNLHPNHYIVAGLFIPRIGITNENHLSTTFNSVMRPFVEQYIIPSTWREIGIGYYGQLEGLDNLYISATVQSGLHSESFSIQEGIRDGRQSGSISSGNNLSHTLSLLYYKGSSRFQLSQYIGGSTAINGRVADSLGLNHGPYKNPVSLSEANYQYFGKQLTLKVLGAYGYIHNAAQINTVFANNTPSSFLGYYAELAYDIAPYFARSSKARCNAFLRYEYVNTNFTVPTNGLQDLSNRKQYYMAGLCYKPIQGVAIKANYIYLHTGERNELLIVNPFPQQIPYLQNQHLLQLGIGYNF